MATIQPYSSALAPATANDSSQDFNTMYDTIQAGGATIQQDDAGNYQIVDSSGNPLPNTSVLANTTGNGYNTYTIGIPSAGGIIHTTIVTSGSSNQVSPITDYTQQIGYQGGAHGGFINQITGGLGTAISNAVNNIANNPTQFLVDVGMTAAGYPTWIAGAAGGAAGAAASGQNILKGAVTGGLTGEAGTLASDATAGLGTTIQGAAQVAASGATGAALTGQNPLTAALTGGAIGGVIGYATSGSDTPAPVETANPIPVDGSGGIIPVEPVTLIDQIDNGDGTVTSYMSDGTSHTSAIQPGITGNAQGPIAPANEDYGVTTTTDPATGNQTIHYGDGSSMIIDSTGKVILTTDSTGSTYIPGSNPLLNNTGGGNTDITSNNSISSTTPIPINTKSTSTNTSTSTQPVYPVPVYTAQPLNQSAVQFHTMNPVYPTDQAGVNSYYWGSGQAPATPYGHVNPVGSSQASPEQINPLWPGGYAAPLASDAYTGMTHLNQAQPVAPTYTPVNYSQYVVPKLQMNNTISQQLAPPSTINWANGATPIAPTTTTTNSSAVA